MKKSKAVVAVAGVALIIAIGAMAGRTVSAAGPAPVNIGTAATFSVLAGTAVTNTGATTIDRSVGTSPGTSVTGFPPGIVGGTIHAGDAAALQAQSDLTAAYLVAAGAPVTATYSALGGRTLVGGVYNAGGATLDLTGTLTLDAQFDPSSVWIFQATSDLVTASSSAVSFVNGASPCNVFWQVTSSATLGSGSTFVGTILALTSITVADNVTVYGRALARNGLVSLINDRFLTLACAGGASVTPAPPVPPTRPPFTVAPSATATVAPTAAAIATATPTIAPAPTPASIPDAAIAVAELRTLPSTSTDEPPSPLLICALGLAGIGILVLRRKPIQPNRRA